MSLEAEMLAHIKAGVDHHNATCPMPARAILLNTGNYELFGWDELCGLPVEPRDEIPPKRFRIDCPGSAYGIEEEIAEAVGEPLEAPELVPVAPAPRRPSRLSRAARRRPAAGPRRPACRGATRA